MSRALLVVVLAGLLAHAPGLAGGFVYDDHRFVAENPALGDLDVGAALLDPATHTADRDRDVYRPLRALSHAWDRSRWGLDPFGFHLHSLLLHAAVVATAFLALRRLLPEPSPWSAACGAGLLAVHPLGVEVVGWISSRGDLLAAWLGLVALLCGSVGGRAAAPAVVASALAAGLATLGKESAAVIPAVAWLARRTSGRGHRLAPWAMALGVVAALALRQIALQGSSPQQTMPHGGDLLAQAVWALHGLGRTLAHVLVPTELLVEYPHAAWAQGPPVWIAPATLAGAAAVAAPFVLRRQGGPVAAFLAGWALLAYLPSSSLLVTLRSLVNDRAAYPLLAPAGALLGLATAGGRWRRVAAVVALAALVPLTWERTAAFASDEALWRDTLQKDPTSVRARLGLAAVAPPAQAERLLAEAVRFAPAGGKEEAVALALHGSHLLHVMDDPGGAVAVLERALAALDHWAARERPTISLPATAASLAEAYERTGRAEAADVLLERAIAIDPSPAALLVKRAVLRRLRAEQAASDDLRRSADAQAWDDAWRAAEVAPDDPLVQALHAWLSGRGPVPGTPASPLGDATTGRPGELAPRRQR